ncbi:MAG: FKBP-type peptidyl-prolyl cis-trans isomerase [Bacteroidales bacterium]|nr:FKBP-type peptidyl-prolyl cis-trans isomerase [Bacteroidales bacterium]
MGRDLIILLVIITSAVIACRNNPEPAVLESFTDEQLIEINRQLVINDRERIESYIKRKNLHMKMSGTGFWYSVSDSSAGKMIKEGGKVVLEYECHLLDGTLCYSSENDGLLEFIVGNSNVISGLDEGVRMMAEGSEAILIIPGYKGYGLPGDGKKIPGRAVLVYKLKVINYRDKF